MDEIQTAVTAFIVENFLFGNEEEAPKPDASFMETGLIDSTGILELVAFAEEEYEVSIADDQLIPENLDSVQNLTKFIARLQKEQE